MDFIFYGLCVTSHMLLVAHRLQVATTVVVLNTFTAETLHEAAHVQIVDHCWPVFATLLGHMRHDNIGCINHLCSDRLFY